jgi:hypothetical protein
VPQFFFVNIVLFADIRDDRCQFYLFMRNLSIKYGIGKTIITKYPAVGFTLMKISTSSLCNPFQDKVMIGLPGGGRDVVEFVNLSTVTPDNFADRGGGNT